VPRQLLAEPPERVVVRRRLVQRHAEKAAERQPVAKRLLGRRVGQAMPSLASRPPIRLRSRRGQETAQGPGATTPATAGRSDRTAARSARRKPRPARPRAPSSRAAPRFARALDSTPAPAPPAHPPSSADRPAHAAWPSPATSCAHKRITSRRRSQA
jgi:hypothetical protein